MSPRQEVTTREAPAAIGPYSQAIKAGNWLFVSGQVALDPRSGELIDGDVAAQTRQVMHNLDRILDAAGVSFEAVVRTTIYLADLGDFATVNDIYASHFEAPAPARATVQVSRLPKDARVEIDAIALLP